MKRMKKIIPAAFVLSSALLVAPGFSSADTNTTNIGNLPVVISSQKAPAPMTAEQAERSGLPIPEAPVGPYQEFPYEAYSSTQYGDLIDYVYVDLYAKKAQTLSTKDLKDTPFLIVLPDGTRVNEVKDDYNLNITPGKLAYTIGLSKETFKEILSDTKLKKDIYWKLIDSNIVGKNDGYHWSKSVTSGLSKSNTLGFSLTVGFEAGFGETAKFSTELTTSFESNTTITDETSTTRTFDYNPKPDYAYDQYRTALYQQVAKYSVQPGSKLNEFINSATNSNEYYEFKLKQAYNYPVDVLVSLTSK
ncbi:hypothetical protein [Bacillus toyonensis]|uniref:hypothetical protein n=1 Tax=Bacillus toyonensis TaxID=155322 RepID=UPI000BEBD04C|nr:hypothetical protein [Bacillus toyonensis]PEA72978.1 hypothetical protein COO00_08690 [Bacillus toyonensis]PFW89028.1 hypothetical protein COL33_22790 [Bacillus toyonensis]PHF64290.1 hypothetical protein COI52_30505 [Bacillus toyonensis]PHF81922.1 hypothetical protein COI46_27245 [Bacillus toyonensis]